MSNALSPQGKATNKHAGRNSPSDIDELRDNIADIASGVREYLTIGARSLAAAARGEPLA
jgi:hypothetical protein